MAYFGGDKYYEGEYDKVKVSPSDFALDAKEELEESTVPIITYLKSIENDILERFETKDSKLDSTLANTLFGQVYKKFEKDFAATILFDEITAFFEFDYIKFFKLLDIPYKRVLMKSLREKVDITHYVKKRREKQAQMGGAYQPSFKKL